MNVEIPTPDELEDSLRVENEMREREELRLVQKNAEPLLLYMAGRLRSGVRHISIERLQLAMLEVSDDAYRASLVSMPIIVDALTPYCLEKGWRLEVRGRYNPPGSEIYFAPVEHRHSDSTGVHERNPCVAVSKRFMHNFFGWLVRRVTGRDA